MIGLERLWGGLPSDGKAALAVAASEMEKIHSVHYNSNTTIKASFEENGASIMQSFLKKKASFTLSPNNMGRVLGISNVDENQNKITMLPIVQAAKNRIYTNYNDLICKSDSRTLKASLAMY